MNDLTIGVDEKVGLGKGILLAVQHVLSMDLYVMPIILGGILGMATQELSFFISMGFVVCGIGTIIQTGFGIRLPVVQGPAYVPLGALAAIGTTQGVDVMIGSLIPGAVLVVILGVTGAYSWLMEKVVPPFIGGVVLLIIGVSLVPTTVSGVLSTDGDLVANSASGLVTVLVLVVCFVAVYVWKKRLRLLSISSVIIAILGGCLVALAMGQLDFSSVTEAAWFQVPVPLHFGIRFELGPCILMAFIYLILLVDTTATWIAVSDVTGVSLGKKRLTRAVVAEGAGCLIASLFGGTPVTGYSSNVGIISITRVGSRRVILIAGVVLIVLGLVPKLMTVLACIPTSIINGVFLLVCMILISKGISIIQSTSEIDERKMLILGISVAATIGVSFVPAELVALLPEAFGYFLSSGTALGATVAIVLQIVLPPIAGRRKTVTSDGQGPDQQ
ncbi:MAG: purine/pyrimidine permease [Coriobacteriales bacterium]|jgi:NCS2 family nucleobase:cation symporter-2|nr:purine/pyrimidine permease [Coriobacteriales bacterium]